MNNKQSARTYGFIVENDVSFNTFSVIHESADQLPEGVLMRLRGTFIPMNVAGENGRWYTYEDYAPHVLQLQEKIARKELWGEIEHPQRVHVPYDLASHRIDKVYFDPPSNSWVGEISILDTVKGRDVYNIARTGAPIYVSHRALGSSDPKTGKGAILKLLTWDVTSNPSFKMAEFNNAQQINESFSLIPFDTDFINEGFEALGIGDGFDHVNESGESPKVTKGKSFEHDGKNWKVTEVGETKSMCKSGSEESEFENTYILDSISCDNKDDEINESFIAVSPSSIVDFVRSSERGFITAQEMIDPEFKFENQYLHPNDLDNAIKALAKSGLLYDTEAKGYNEKSPDPSALLTVPQIDIVVAREQSALADALQQQEQEEKAQTYSDAGNSVQKFANESVGKWAKKIYSRVKKWINQASDAPVTIDGTEYIIDKIEGDEKVILINPQGDPVEYTFDEVYKYINSNESEDKESIINENNSIMLDKLKTILKDAKFSASSDYSEIENGIEGANADVTADLVSVIKEGGLKCTTEGNKIFINESDEKDEDKEINESDEKDEDKEINESDEKDEDKEINESDEKDEDKEINESDEKDEDKEINESDEKDEDKEINESDEKDEDKEINESDEKDEDKEGRVDEIKYADEDGFIYDNEEDEASKKLDESIADDMTSEKEEKVTADGKHIDESDEKDEDKEINESDEKDEDKDLNESFKKGDKVTFKGKEGKVFMIDGDDVVVDFGKDGLDSGKVSGLEFVNESDSAGDLVEDEVKGANKDSVVNESDEKDEDKEINESDEKDEDKEINESDEKDEDKEINESDEKDEDKEINESDDKDEKDEDKKDLNENTEVDVREDGNLLTESEDEKDEDKEVNESEDEKDEDKEINESDDKDEDKEINESEDVRADGNQIDTGDGTEDDKHAQKLASEYHGLADKAVTFENWIATKAESDSKITPLVVLTAKSVLSKLETTDMINESAKLTANFVNESATFLSNQSEHLGLLRNNLPENYKFMFDNLNESAKLILSEQAKFYNLNESNVHEFISTREWSRIANASVNESANALNAIRGNNFNSSLMRSIQASKGF